MVVLWSRPAVFRATVLAELAVGLQVAMLLWALKREGKRGGERQERERGTKKECYTCPRLGVGHRHAGSEYISCQC